MPYFFAGIPLAKPYVIGYMGEKFGEPGSLPAKGEFASFGTSHEFNLNFSSGMERTSIFHSHGSD